MVAGNLPPDGPAPASGWDTPVVPPVSLIASGTGSGSNTATATLSGGTIATAGDLLVAACCCRDNAPNNPSSYTQQGATIGVTSSNARGKLWTKTAAGGETAVTVTTPGSDSPYVILALFRPFVNLAGVGSAATAGPSATPSQAITPTGSAPWVVVAFFTGGIDGAGASGPVAAASGYTQVQQNGHTAGSAFCPYGIMIYRDFTGTVTNPSITSPNQRYGVVSAVFEG